MKLNRIWKFLALALFAAFAACADDTPDKSGTYSKEDGAALNGTLPDGRDLCDVANWYGDGQCDAFCPLPDIDCGCQTDSDCGAGEMCQNGACETGPKCTRHDDCQPGEVCGPDELCHRNGTPQDCQSDSDCNANEVCDAGTCEPDATAMCTADADCAANEFCNAGACEQAIPIQCTVDADCDENEFCSANGECLPFEMPPPTCQADSDCAPNEVCVDGECELDGTDRLCQTDRDCRAGETCDDTNRCVATICGGFAGFQCPPEFYCDFDESVGTACGAADGTGVCTRRPDTCNTGISPVCGCDGMDYSNACEAFSAGTDYWAEGKCQD